MDLIKIKYSKCILVLLNGSQQSGRCALAARLNPHPVVLCHFVTAHPHPALLHQPLQWCYNATFCQS